MNDDEWSLTGGLVDHTWHHVPLPPLHGLLTASVFIRIVLDSTIRISRCRDEMVKSVPILHEISPNCHKILQEFLCGLVAHTWHHVPIPEFCELVLAYVYFCTFSNMKMNLNLKITWQTWQNIGVCPYPYKRNRIQIQVHECWLKRLTSHVTELEY